ncbi:TPA: hypothetical protein HA239_01370 [Candidatus Woesearchaeota archaeon]|nr:hypothetical protein QT06_C0001G0440 [archaeon GW2011_AR15]MBS3103751.1 hypothetical protein [Candidatus Woesearchaeota archaeon]HIH41042.1 hypothetical protein [Candidatus Woesearchaeota archaeon]
MRTRKAQVAVETLLIYGVTILIVMLAIGALIGFGVIDLGRLLPDRCDISNAFTCENYAVLQDSVQLELRNTLGKNIDGFTVTIEGEGDNEGLWGCSPANVTGILVNGVLSDVVTLDCDIQVPSGKKIQGDITLTFYTVGSQIERTATGKIRATVS